MEEVLCFHVHLNSNTTLVKVKFGIPCCWAVCIKNSNTTLVKVKYINDKFNLQGDDNSNTTLVKVKWYSSRHNAKTWQIQIQHLLKLNMNKR